MKPLEIKLDNNLYLVAGDIGADEYREFFVSVCTKDDKGEYVFLQDIAVVGQDYEYEEDEVSFLPRFSVKIYADAESDDWTTEYLVDLVDLEKIYDWTPPPIPANIAREILAEIEREKQDS